MRDMYRFCIQVFLILTVNQSNVYGQKYNRPNLEGPAGLQVNSYTGNLFFERSDIFIKGRKMNLDIRFFYNTAAFQTNKGYGNGWSFNYGMFYKIDSAGMYINWGEGQSDYYLQDTSGQSIFSSPIGVYDSLSNYAAGKFKLITKDRMEYWFEDSIHRQVTKISEPNGNTLNFIYQDSLLTQVADGAGRSIQLVYASGLLVQVIDANGPARTYSYQYDSYKNLIQVVDPLGNTIKYKYIVNGPLADVTDKNNNTCNIIYNPSFGVKELISCNSRMAFVYNDKALSTNVVDYIDSGENQITSYHFNEGGNLIKKQGNCCGFKQEYEYDDDSNISKITDANGKVYEYNYDNRGNLLTSIDPMGHTINYTYQQDIQKVKSMTDANGNTTTFTYDNRGNIIQVLRPLGIKDSYVYAANGDILSFTDAGGNVTNYGYDNFGNRISEQRPLGAVFNYTYNQRSLNVTETDPLNHTTTSAYDLLDRLVSITDPAGSVESYAYDALGNLISITDKNSHTSVNGYDAANRLTNVLDANGNTLIFGFDAKDNLISAIDQNGALTKFSYDSQNRLIGKLNALNEVTALAYDANGNISQVHYPNGNQLSFTYDEINRLLEINDSQGLVASYTYDGNNNILTKKDGMGQTTTYSYDALNRNTSVMNPAGYAELKNYDFRDNLLSAVDRMGKSVNYAYDALGRLIQKTDQLNKSSQFTYDVSGNLLSVSDEKNQVTLFNYSIVNELISKTFANGTQRLFNYDAKGNVVSAEDGNGVVVNYLYDSMDRLITVDKPGADDMVFSYSPVGQIVSATNNHAVLLFNYDAVGRLTSESMNGYVTGYSYDTPGNKSSIIYPSGKIVRESYDKRERLTRVDLNNQLIAAFNLDAANRISAITYGNGLNISKSYDAVDNVVSILSNPSSLQNVSMSYDANGRMITANTQHLPLSSQQYAYDDKGRLTAFKQGLAAGSNIPSPLVQATYNYDATNNFSGVVRNGLTQTFTSGATNNYTAMVDTAVHSFNYDGNGNLLFDGVHSYQYDVYNQLTSVDSGSTATYVRDALGRRIRKSTSAGTLDYFYSGYNVIETLDSSGLGSYVYGQYMDQVLAKNLNGANFFFHHNRLGSTESISDSLGNLVERYVYDAYGDFQILNQFGASIPESVIKNLFTYTGREFDQESGNFHFMFRTYNVLLDRFQQHDPIGYTINDFNFYNYVFNDVYSYVDPDGLHPVNVNASNRGDGSRQMSRWELNRIIDQMHRDKKNMDFYTRESPEPFSFIKWIKKNVREYVTKNKDKVREKQYYKEFGTFGNEVCPINREEIPELDTTVAIGIRW